MGKNDAPSLPDAPEFQADPNVRTNADFLSTVGLGLGQGGFIPGVNPQLPERLQGGPGSDLSFLNPLVQINPEVTRQSIDLASRDTIETRDRAQQSILNQLEANNQLTSSVTGNALTDLNRSFSSDIADIATTFRLADEERSLQNTRDLFTLGLQTSEGAGQIGLNNQNQMNSFNLQNFDNQLGLSLLDYEQQQQNDAFWGQMSGQFFGPVGGAIIGGATGGQTGARAGSSAGWGTVGAVLGAMGGSGAGAQQQSQQMAPQSLGGPSITGYTAEQPQRRTYQDEFSLFQP